MAGFTGRSQEQVQAHVAELAAKGVTAPRTTPTFYLVTSEIVVQTGRITVTHSHTSGEVEIALLVSGNDRYVTLASDHTDRAAEAGDIGLAKQLCPKVLASSAWNFSDVAANWDDLFLQSWIEEDGQRVLYQQGGAAELLRPDQLLRRIPFQRRPASCLVLMGTLPVIGKLRSSNHFWAELRDPRTRRSITLDYVVQNIGDVLS